MKSENKAKELYKEEPIREEKEDTFGRSVYAKVIADTIANAGGAFNFGISGEWGSGKSSVLNLVEPLLKKKDFLVVRFNPWKISTDAISIRRRFLIDLVAGLRAEGVNVELPENLSKSITRISGVTWTEKLKIVGWTAVHFLLWFAAIGIIPLLVCYGLDLLFAYLNWTIASLASFYYGILFLPAFGALIPTFRYYLTRLTVERVDPEIKVAEQFEEEFEKIIVKTRINRKDALNLVIFVDDLDRAQPKDVMTIFSSIMTFFERKGITFLISADQKMVENIIVKELGENSNPREFVKKLFQVNWIIPPIPIHLQEGFVRSNFPKIVTPEEEIADKLAPEWIINMVIKEFGGNPRKVKYFMRELEFQIRAVKAMIEEIENRESKDEINYDELTNLENICKHPELLAKILIIRSSDRFERQWDTILKAPQKILQEETGDGGIGEPLKTFLKSRPFFNEYDQSPQYYVYFSGITGFEETLLADPSHLAEFAKRGDIEKLKSIMQGTLDIHRVGHLDSIIAKIKEAKEPPEKINYAKSFSQTLSMLEDFQNRKRMLFKFIEVIEEANKQQPIIQAFNPIDFEGLVRNLDNTAESLKQAQRMMNESPYTAENIRHKLWAGFASASSYLPPEILTVVCKRLVGEIHSAENVQNQVLLAFQQIGQNLSKSENKEKVVDSLIEILTKRPIGSKINPLQALNSCSSAINDENKQIITNHFTQLGASGNIQDVIFVTKHLGLIVDITKGKQVVDSIVKHSSSRNMGERQQIISNLEQHQSAVEDEQRNAIVSGLVQALKGTNRDESMKALDLLKTHRWLLPGNLELKFEQLNEILGVIERKESPLTQQLINMFYDIRSAYEKEKPIRDRFTKILQGLRNDPDSNISIASNKILNEIEGEQSSFAVTG
jgi:hypothetical protein